MRLILLVITFTLLTACGNSKFVPTTLPQPPTEPTCLVEYLEDGVYLSCDDGDDTFFPYPEEDDEDGDEVVIENCKRGRGHKKHDHTKHEPCEEE